MTVARVAAKTSIKKGRKRQRLIKAWRRRLERTSWFRCKTPDACRCWQVANERYFRSRTTILLRVFVFRTKTIHHCMEYRYFPRSPACVVEGFNLCLPDVLSHKLEDDPINSHLARRPRRAVTLSWRIFQPPPSREEYSNPRRKQATNHINLTSSSLLASRMYCLRRCILFLKRYIATARPPICAEDANPGGPVTSPTAKMRGFVVRKALSTCLVVVATVRGRWITKRARGAAGVECVYVSYIYFSFVSSLDCFADFRALRMSQHQPSKHRMQCWRSFIVRGILRIHFVRSVFVVVDHQEQAAENMDAVILTLAASCTWINKLVMARRH